MSTEFFYLKIVKCCFGEDAYYEEYFIHPNHVFKLRPEGMKIFDDIDKAIAYKEEFLSMHKNCLDIKWSDIQVNRL